MQSVAAAVKAVLVPGSVPFLILGVIFGAVLLWGSSTARRWSRRWLVALGLFYWAASVPIGADVLTAVVGYGYGPIVTADEARGASAVVVLDGGTARYAAAGREVTVVKTSSAFRALETARVYDLMDDPWVFVTAGSGEEGPETQHEGSALHDTLVGAGVPPERIVIDTTSRNTREHATHMEPLLRRRGISRVVLVTSLTHIRRSVWAFRAVGIDVVPSPAAVRSPDRSDWRWTQWWPRADALKISRDTVRDAMAVVYYGMLGWF